MITFTKRCSWPVVAGYLFSCDIGPWLVSFYTSRNEELKSYSTEFDHPDASLTKLSVHRRWNYKLGRKTGKTQENIHRPWSAGRIHNTELSLLAYLNN